MVKLRANAPCGNLLPRTVASVTLEEVDLGVLTLISPLLGQGEAVSAVLESSVSFRMPNPGITENAGENRIIWFGRDAALLCGPACPDLSGIAATCDQSDAWACVRLTGDKSVDILARLVPVDLRDHVFPQNHTARTQLGHMHTSITRLDEASFLIMVFRSMATSLVHEIEEAMEAVAARG